MSPASGRILIVDDEPAVLEALGTALSPPHDVVTAPAGLAALEMLGQQSFDLVLLDYVLPDLSGLAILQMMTQCFPYLQVILMTGFGSEDVCLAAFRGGVRDYLKKPIDLRELVAQVGEALATRGPGTDPEPPPRPLACAAVPAHANGAGNGGIRRALAFIDGHLDCHLSLDQVAREAGMSKFHFCRQFKADTGLTFREFLARRRIARATELLREGNRLVSEVCLDVGFKDLSHFGRVFRKITGQPPSRYRRLPN